MKIFVIGDMGGHARVFELAIRAAGGDPASGEIAPDHIIVQAGDLVRLVPNQVLESDACVEIADRMLLRSPGQWIQLWGNHEAGCVGGPRAVGWRPEVQLAPQTLKTLNRWWREKTALVAVGGTTVAHGDVLITHAGISRHLWSHYGHLSGAQMVSRLNATMGGTPGDAFRAGRLVTGQSDVAVSPIWAEVNREFYETWWGRDAPFTQIHGHASPWHWACSDWWPDTPRRIRRHCVVDRTTRRTVTRLGGEGTRRPAIAIGVDWGLEGSDCVRTWPTLDLEIDAEQTVWV